MAAGVAAVESAGSTGSSWLLNKTITPRSDPQASIGQEFYVCYGSGEEDSDMAINVLRKGRKASCTGSDLTIAITKANFDKKGILKSEKYLDVMDVNIPTGYRLMLSCGYAAAVAIAKMEDGESTKSHLKAWEIKDNKFAPLSNLKNISCSKLFL